MRSKKLTYAQIFHFFEQLHALLGAGITPQAALRIMGKDAENESIKALLEQLEGAAAQGKPLSSAIREAADYEFPNYVNELLVIGEQTGRLDDVCGALSRYYEDEDELRTAIRSAVTYPAAMVTMMFVVVIVLFSKVMPVFAEVFEQLGASVSGFAQHLMNISAALSRFYVVLIVLFAVVAAVFLYFYCTDSGQKKFAQLVETFPLTRKFSEDLALTRFAGGMQLTSAAGLDPYTSLHLVSRIVGNKTVQEKIAACVERLREGESFSEAVSGAGMFNDFYSGMISVFAEAGSVDKAMDFIARHYRKETDRRISSVLSAIEPTMVAVLSIVVGLVLLSVILPLMGIMTNIG